MAILEDPKTKNNPPSPPPPNLKPRHATLKDGSPVTLYPITNGSTSLPTDLVRLLHDQFSKEIEAGSTYPMEEPMGFEQFADYWFGTFAVVAVLGEEEVIREGRNWEEDCLGTFYIKPNYPGRCSHICNAGFFTTPAARNRGVGIVMGQTYLEYAPKLGYKSSVFNLVFENNVASIKIWEKLGFNIIGRVPECGRLANSDKLVDALIIGKKFDS